MMGQFEQLDQMLTAQEGMLRTSQVVSSGISKPVFYDYVRSRDLDRVAHGIYLSKDSWVDAMYLLHLRFEQAVFSHETALFFHDLTDREPIEYTVTVIIRQCTLFTMTNSARKSSQYPNKNPPMHPVTNMKRHRLVHQSETDRRINSKEPNITGKAIQHTSPLGFLPCKPCQLAVRTVIMVCPHQ